MHKHISIGIFILGLPLVILSISLLALLVSEAPKDEYTVIWVLTGIMEAIFIVPSLLLIRSGITNKPVFSQNFKTTPLYSKFVSKSDVQKPEDGEKTSKSDEDTPPSDDVNFTF